MAQQPFGDVSSQTNTYKYSQSEMDEKDSIPSSTNQMQNRQIIKEAIKLLKEIEAKVRRSGLSDKKKWEICQYVTDDIGKCTQLLCDGTGTLSEAGLSNSISYYKKMINIVALEPYSGGAGALCFDSSGSASSEHASPSGGRGGDGASTHDEESPLDIDEQMLIHMNGKENYVNQIQFGDGSFLYSLPQDLLKQYNVNKKSDFAPLQENKLVANSSNKPRYLAPLPQQNRYSPHQKENLFGAEPCDGFSPPSAPQFSSLSKPENQSQPRVGFSLAPPQTKPSRSADNSPHKYLSKYSRLCRFAPQMSTKSRPSPIFNGNLTETVNNAAPPPITPKGRRVFGNL